MKCSNCNSEWESAVKIHVCPFCGKPLTIAWEELSVSVAITRTIDKFGLDILKTPNKLVACIMDFVKGHERDKKLFRIACNAGILPLMYDAKNTQDKAQQQMYLNKAVKQLEEEAFLSADHAGYIVRAIAEGISVSYTMNDKSTAHDEHIKTVEIKKSSRILGINLDFNQSRVAVLKDGKPVIIPNAFGERKTSSVVSFSKDGKVLTGKMAERIGMNSPQRLFPAMQAYIRPNHKVMIDSEEYTSQEITAFFLRQLKKDAEGFLGEGISDAIIALPSKFNDVQRQAIVDAGAIAGLNIVRMLAVSTAAAISYSLKVSGEQIILACHMSGSNIDVSVIESGSGVLEVLSVAGIPAAEIQNQDAASGCPDKMLESVKKTAVHAIRDAGLKFTDISQVILTGDMADTPELVEGIRILTGRKLLSSQNSEEIAAAGAAHYGGRLTGYNMGVPLLMDVMPMSLCVETQGGVATYIINRNSIIPLKASYIFTAYEDNQSTVDIHVLQGERLFVKDNQSLGHFIADGITNGKKEEALIKAEFCIEADKKLKISVENMITGKEQHITNLNPYCMSQQCIRKAAERVSEKLF